MSIFNFFLKVKERASSTKEREGQAAFNLLYEINPKLADNIRGTEADPYYSINREDTRWKKFCDFINNHYDEIESNTNKK